MLREQAIRRHDKKSAIPGEPQGETEFSGLQKGEKIYLCVSPSTSWCCVTAALAK